MIRSRNFIGTVEVKQFGDEVRVVTLRYFGHKLMEEMAVTCRRPPGKTQRRFIEMDGATTKEAKWRVGWRMVIYCGDL